MDTQPQRRSTRKKRKSNEQLDTPSAGSSSSQMDCIPTVQPSHKRGKRTSHKLAGLLDMPLDILFEVFGHLHPSDLIRLARTNKELRRLLLKKSSVSIWKTSLSNVPGLPECPSNMSEPAWASLLFSPYCQFCATHARTVDWLLRVRMCTKCCKQHLRNLFDKEPELRAINNEAGILNDLRWFVRTRKDQRFARYLPSEYEEAMKEYSALKSQDERRDYLQERKKTIERDMQHAARCELWAKSQEEARETELEELRKERLNAIKKKLEELGWGKDLSSICYPDSLRSLNVVNRPQRLTEKIWANIKDEVIWYMEGMREKRLQREYEATVKERKKIAIEFLRSYKNARPTENAVLPEPPDFCEFEPIKNMINQPAEVEVNLPSFDPIVPQLPALIDRWRGQIEQEMLKIIENVRDNRTANKVLAYDEFSEEYYYRIPDESRFPFKRLSEDQLRTKLKLASSVFTCRNCEPPAEDYSWYPDDWAAVKSRSQLLFYPQVLGHPCLTVRSAYCDNWSNHDPVHALTRGDIQMRKPWARTGLEFNLYGSERAEWVVKYCGLDPATATTEDVDNLNLRFACRLCSRDPQTGDIDSANRDGDPLQAGCVLPLFEWRAAVRHLIDQGHERADFTSFKRDELTQELIQAEEDHRLKCNDEWFCIHCRDTPGEKKLGSVETLKYHFRSYHSNINPIMGQDYRRHFTAPDVHASQPLFFVRMKDGQLSAFKPPEEYANSSDAGNFDYDDPFTRMTQRALAEKWSQAR